MTYTYLFEAKSIQSYIFSTNKLKEIVGGSELIESLTAKTGLLKQTLQVLELEEDIKLSRCGGAAFYAFSKNKEAIDKLTQFWPLVFRQYAPDLEFIHAYAEGLDEIKAFEAAHKALMTDRNRPKVKLPQVGVYTLRFGRTGEPVTKRERKGKDIKNFDQITERKLLPEFAKSETLAERVLWDSHKGEWPINLTPEEGQEGKNFPFTKDNNLVGLIHADGNGLGQLLITLKTVVNDPNNDAITAENYIEVFRAISDAIKQATETAAAEAVRKILLPNMQGGLFPARPIVLGGDDLTMIVRADLALPFTQVFLQAFEEKSGKQFDILRKDHPKLITILPQKLSACAGIVYAHSSQPFSALHELAEGLCKHTKNIAKKESNLINHQVPSSLSFYRVTSTLLDDFDDVLKRELTTGKITLARGCYTLEAKHDHLPKLTNLLELQKFLEQSEISKGALRQVTALLHHSPTQAQRRYNRWREVMIDRDPKSWERLNLLLHRLSEPKADFDINKQQSVPFEDVLSLSAVGNQLIAEKGEQQ